MLDANQFENEFPMYPYTRAHTHTWILLKAQTQTTEMTRAAPDRGTLPEMDFFLLPAYWPRNASQHILVISPARMCSRWRTFLANFHVEMTPPSATACGTTNAPLHARTQTQEFLKPKGSYVEPGQGKCAIEFHPSVQVGRWVAERMVMETTRTDLNLGFSPKLFIQMAPPIGLDLRLGDSNPVHVEGTTRFKPPNLHARSNPFEAPCSCRATAPKQSNLCLWIEVMLCNRPAPTDGLKPEPGAHPPFRSAIPATVGDAAGLSRHAPRAFSGTPGASFGLY